MFSWNGYCFRSKSVSFLGDTGRIFSLLEFFKSFSGFFLVWLILLLLIYSINRLFNGISFASKGKKVGVGFVMVNTDIGKILDYFYESGEGWLTSKKNDSIIDSSSVKAYWKECFYWIYENFFISVSLSWIIGFFVLIKKHMVDHFRIREGVCLI